MVKRDITIRAKGLVTTRQLRRSRWGKSEMLIAEDEERPAVAKNSATKG
jgi:hypothetical protein